MTGKPQFSRVVLQDRNTSCRLLHRYIITLQAMQVVYWAAWLACCQGDRRKGGDYCTLSWENSCLGFPSLVYGLLPI